MENFRRHQKMGSPSQPASRHIQLRPDLVKAPAMTPPSSSVRHLPSLPNSGLVGGGAPSAQLQLLPQQPKYGCGGGGVVDGYWNRPQVFRNEPVLVRPSRPTPNHVLPLPLNDVSRFRSPHYEIFRPGGGFSSPAGLRQALEKLLVPYYPLAGRLRCSQNGCYEVSCGGEGAVFVEAWADITVEEFLIIVRRERFPWDNYFCYDYPNYERCVDFPPLAVQVTRLSCGSYVFGIRICEALCDSAGVLQFLNGWAEFARGKPSVSVNPWWGRDFPCGEGLVPRAPFHPPCLDFALPTDRCLPPVYPLPAPPCCVDEYIYPVPPPCFPGFPAPLCPAPPPYLSPTTVVDLTTDSVVALRKQLATENVQCTSFEVMTAHVWRERARAICLPLPSRVRIFFLSSAGTNDCCDQTPKAYYGLHAFNVQVVACPGDLLANPLSYTVKLIQDAKACLVENFQKCIYDFAEVFQPCAYPNLGNIFMTELPVELSCRFDFGFGNLTCPDPLGEFVHVNVAALFHRVNNYDNVYIAMNNLPQGLCEQFKQNFNAVEVKAEVKVEAKSKL